MIEPQMEFVIWATLEVGGFAIAVFVAYRRMRQALTVGQRLRRAVEVVVLYGIVLSSAYATWFYLERTFTLYGAFLFGCISGGIHVVIIATLILIAWRFVPQLR